MKKDREACNLLACKSRLVGNPRTEVNIVEIYYDLFNVSWSTDRQ